jgi:hypothetical protein
MFVPRPFVCLEMGSSFRREEGLVLLCECHICCTIISHEYTRTHSGPGEGICTLWTPYTLYHFATLNNTHALLSVIKVNWIIFINFKSKLVTTHCQSASLSWCQAPSETQDQIFVTVRQLRVCWCGALSLTRGRVCRLQLLMALASAVILGSDSPRTRDHIVTCMCDCRRGLDS